MSAVPALDDAPTREPAGILERTPIVALRVLQFAVDLAILAVLTVLPFAVLLMLLPKNPDGSVAALLVAIPLVLVLLVLTAVISWGYWAWWPRRHNGQTLAMGWFGLRVVRLDEGPAAMSQLTLRWLLLLVDAMFFGLVGLIAMLISSAQQRIGDELARTIVVRDAG